MPDITVPVPDDRAAEFYQFFGLWLAEGLQGLTGTSQAPKQPSEPSVKRPWTGSDDDTEDAESLWKKLSTRGRAMFSLLIDNPGTPYTGWDIANTLNIPNGPNGVAGVLAWPGRFCLGMNRPLPTNWKNGEDGAESIYWMDPEVAALFNRVRTPLTS